MNQNISLNISQLQGQKQTQHLMMSPQMQKALSLLQMPVLELSFAIEQELLQNPLLESIDDREVEEERDPPIEQEVSFDEEDYQRLRHLEEEFREHFSQSECGYRKKSDDEERLQAFLESSLQKQLSLYESLVKQAHQTFDDKRDFEIAELMIGHFDERGFLESSLEELFSQELKRAEKVLEEIQKFEPFGVGARSLQESLLIQLKCLGKQKSLAYRIVEHYFDSLLHNRIPLIAKHLNESQELVNLAINTDIRMLDLKPGMQLSCEVVPYIKPDVILRLDGENLIVDVEGDLLPPFRLNRSYLLLLDRKDLSHEEKGVIKSHLVSAKWLIRNLFHRNQLIEKIAESLSRHQREFFFNPKGILKPITMKIIADELEVHESTVARAVANKYLDTPRGILPFRSFFSHAYVMKDGKEISLTAVRNFIKEITDQEDKTRPFSDAAISDRLKKMGVACARRTVAKHRGVLNLGSARQRKRHL